MSGSTKKGPERPAEVKADESTPLYGSSSFSLQGKYPKVVMIVLCVILAVMLIIAFAFCVYNGVQHTQPRYFLLIINIILSTLVTALLIFWFFRGTLSSMMIWYVFVQCVFLLFQFITTDIFAWYANAPPVLPTTAPSWSPIVNCSVTPVPKICNESNTTTAPNISHYGPLFEEKYFNF